MYGFLIALGIAYVVLPKILVTKHKKKQTIRDDDNIYSHLVRDDSVNDTNGLMPLYKPVIRIPDESLKLNPLTNARARTAAYSIPPSETEVGNYPV